jgi:hypothetical protein
MGTGVCGECGKPSGSTRLMGECSGTAAAVRGLGVIATVVAAEATELFAVPGVAAAAPRLSASATRDRLAAP